MPFEEVHANAEIQASVGLGRHQADISPLIVVTLVEQSKISLGV